MTATRSTLMLCVLSAALAAGCSDATPPVEPGPVPEVPAPPPGPAFVRFTVTSTGLDSDADGYLVSLGGAAPQRIGARGASVVTVPAGGPLAITLSDIAPSCTPASANPTGVTAVADQVVEIALAFDCPATTGDLHVRVLHLPVWLGTSLVLDTTNLEHRLNNPNNRTLTIRRLSPGTHTLEVYSCFLVGTSPFVALVTANLITEVTLNVADCGNELW